MNAVTVVEHLAVVGPLLVMKHAYGRIAAAASTTANRTNILAFVTATATVMTTDMLALPEADGLQIFSVSLHTKAQLPPLLSAELYRVHGNDSR